MLENQNSNVKPLKLQTMEIKVLGTGCPKCKALEQATQNAINELGVQATITKVEDIVDIMNYGVMRTPALVINEKVVLSGRVPDAKELKEIITKSQQ
jgi:small redox-active disulfide protein 2